MCLFTSDLEPSAEPVSWVLMSSRHSWETCGWTGALVQMRKPSARPIQVLHSALFLPSSLSCQGAEKGQPVSYCETGSEGQLCLFSCCPRRKMVLLPCVSEGTARFLYTSSTGESKEGMAMTTENESTQERHTGW